MKVIKWDAPPGVFAYRYPSDELGSWSQLVVAESQEAMLVKEGRMCGPFKAGRHTLDTKNFPVLTRFLKMPFSGRTPFTAEVWFVQKAIKLDVMWGSSQPLLVHDSKYGVALPVNASGQFGVRIGPNDTDTKKFLKKLVGTLSSFEEETLSSYFDGIVLTKVKSLIAQVIVDHNVSILDIATKLETISKDLQKCLVKEFAEFGLGMSKFRVTSITPEWDDPSLKELKSALSEKMRLKILGEKYPQVRSFNVMDKAAENQGATGEMLGAGIGFGVGMGAAMPMAQNLFGNITSETQKSESSEPKIACDKCGRIIDANSKFCPGCGDEVCPCPNCGADNPSDATSCRQCKKQLGPSGQCGQCGQCGATIIEGHQFCGTCGVLIKVDNDDE